MANKFLNFLDMVDGGGRGQSGAEFEGGLLSGLGNMMFRPAGYAEREQERLAGVRPQGRPQSRPQMVGGGGGGRPQEVPQAPAPYAGDYFGVDQLPMATDPRYNQTLNFDTSAYHPNQRENVTMYNDNVPPFLNHTDGIGSDAFNITPISVGSDVGAVQPPPISSAVPTAGQNDPAFQEFIGDLRMSPDYRPEYEDIDRIYDSFKLIMGR